METEHSVPTRKIASHAFIEKSREKELGNSNITIGHGEENRNFTKCTPNRTHPNYGKQDLRVFIGIHLKSLQKVGTGLIVG